MTKNIDKEHQDEILNIISSQSLRIKELEARQKEHLLAFEYISMSFVCIGGALNDNVLKYTYAQKMELHEINRIAESFIDYFTNE